MFNFDTRKLDYKEYMKRWNLGVKKYIEKVPDRITDEAVRKMRILYWLDFAVKTILYLCLAYLFCKFLKYGDNYLIKCNSCSPEF